MDDSKLNFSQLYSLDEAKDKDREPADEEQPESFK